MIERAEDDLHATPSRVTPYTTSTGIRIGCRYEPPRNYPMSEDMERLQSAMICRYRTRELLDIALWIASIVLIVAMINAPRIWGWFA